MRSTHASRVTAAATTAALSLLLLTGCISIHKAGTPAPAPTRSVADTGASATPGWLRTELYFGLRDADSGQGISDAEWQAFLDNDVTARFPDGFTVLDAYGQWRSTRSGEIGRQFSRVLVILHPATPAANAAIEDLRSTFAQRHDQESVLRSTQPATVDF